MAEWNGMLVSDCPCCKRKRVMFLSWLVGCFAVLHCPMCESTFTGEVSP